MADMDSVGCMARLRCSTFGSRETVVQFLDPTIRSIRLTGSEKLSCGLDDVVAEWLRIPYDVSIHSEQARLWSYRIPVCSAQLSEQLTVPRGVRFIVLCATPLDVEVLPTVKIQEPDASITDPNGYVLKQVVSYLPLLAQVYLRPVCKKVYEMTKGLTADTVWPVSNWRYRRGHRIIRGPVVRIEDAETCDLCPLHRLIGLRDDDTCAEQFPEQEYDDCYCFYGLDRPQLSDDDASASAPQEDLVANDPVANDPTTIDRPKRTDPPHDDGSWDASWEELVNPTVKTGSFRKMRIWRRVAELTDQWVQVVFVASEGYSSCSIPAGARLVSTLFTGLTYAGRDLGRLYAEMGTVAQFQLQCSSHQVVAIFDQRKCEEVLVGGQGGESFSIDKTWSEEGEKPSHFILHHPTYDCYEPVVHTFRFEDGNPEEEEDPEEENHRQDNCEGSRQACPSPQVSRYPDYPLVKDFPNPMLVVTVRKGFFASRTIVDAVPLFPYLVKDGLRIQIEACGDLGLVHIACVRRGRGGRNKLLHRIQIDTSSKLIQIILDGTDQLMRATHLTYEVEGHCAGFTARHSSLVCLTRPIKASMVPESVNKNTFDHERFCI